MERKDKYDLSHGNIIVLSTIPEMMQHPEWRKKLRELVIDYEMSSQGMGKSTLGLKMLEVTEQWIKQEKKKSKQ